MSQMLIDVVLLLTAAVVLVPIAKKFGLGSVLGYLVAGLIIGPAGFAWIHSTENLAQVSELGVVFLLFVIGLELEPRRLWSLKVHIFGLGGLQVLLVTGAILAAGMALGFTPEVSLVAGLGLAMSSTAISTQILTERSLLNSKGGLSAFSVLLFQDMAVIPILAIVPFLASGKVATQSPPLWMIGLVILGVIGMGQFVMRHVFRVVASARLREVFTALNLLVVVGLAALMHELGVSMALGAFLGGVLLATSEYRHAIETDIEPFKGLLLGLFFMSVGMEMDVATIVAQPWLIVALVMTVIVLKFLIHWGLGRLFRLQTIDRGVFSLLLAQGGEFAFVLFAVATVSGVMLAEQTAVLNVVVALSMGATPLLSAFYFRWVEPRFSARVKPQEDTILNEHPEVLIAGFGRVGQIVGRLLYGNRVRATVLDHDPDQIELVRRFGFKVYYGDATRLDLLEAAGARSAQLLVVAVDDVNASLAIVDMAREHFPHLRLVVRARNVGHVYQLIERGVKIWERETFDSALRMGVEVLRSLGWSHYQAVRAGHQFREHNVRLLYTMERQRGDQRALVSTARQALIDLEKMFAAESENLNRPQEGWDIHPSGR